MPSVGPGTTITDGALILLFVALKYIANRINATIDEPTKTTIKIEGDCLLLNTKGCFHKRWNGEQTQFVIPTSIEKGYDDMACIITMTLRVVILQ